MKRSFTAWGFFGAFLATIPAANWTIHNVGAVCHEICLIPVAPGVMAPSGVIWAGVALCLRDIVHRELGREWAVVGIVLGALLSWMIASPHVALASAVAFLVSEAADYTVYARLAARRFFSAMLASGAVGLVVDSVLFLYIAFGDLEYVEGQLIAKAYAVIGATALIYGVRRRIFSGP